MRVSAKADYAARAAAELAAAPDAPVTADRIAEAQDIPVKFLETILLELKHAGIVRSQRGPDGGYTLARPAEDISLADVIRAVDGPLANVRGDRPENMEYRGAAAPLTDVWIAVRAALREILEATSLANLRDGRLPGAGPRAGRRPGGLGLAGAHPWRRRRLGQRARRPGPPSAEGQQRQVVDPDHRRAPQRDSAPPRSSAAASRGPRAQGRCPDRASRSWRRVLHSPASSAASSTPTGSTLPSATSGCPARTAGRGSAAGGRRRG